jgi:diamine N-acetyltransferase
MHVTIEPVTAANWRSTLFLGVHAQQQRFVAGFAPISAIALAKAYVGAGGSTWAPQLIRADGIPVGFVALTTKPEAPGECWVMHFFIDREHQGRGIGRAAMVELIAHVRGMRGPVERVLLTVHPENVVAQRLYAALGFVPSGEMLEGEPVFVLLLSPRAGRRQPLIP